MPRNKRIKGGEFKLNDTILAKIKNLSTPNNLNPRDVLLGNKYLDDDGYILDNEGKRIEDPVFSHHIKYEDAILINNILYDINSIFQTINAQSIKEKIDVILMKIDVNDVKKIYLKGVMNSNNPNNLKSLEELTKLKIIKEENDKYYLTHFYEEFLKDPHSNNPIEYKNAFLLNGEIYNVISLYNHIIKTGNNLNDEDMKKIKLMISYAKRIEDIDNKNNNLKSLETLKRLGYIDDENYFIGDDGSKVKDPSTNEEIKYENAILINGKLYDVQSLFMKLFKNQAGIKTKKDHLNNDISLDDTKKIRLIYNKLFEICNLSNPNNLKSLLNLKEMGLIDDDNYFIDMTDPITKNRIKYEFGIFVNGNLYDINSIYEFIDKNKDEIKIDFFGIEISKEITDKIIRKKIMILIKDTSSYNNLKEFYKLKSIGNVIGLNMVFNYNIITLFFRKKQIYYDEAILINDNIYYIDSIYKYVVINNNDIDWFGVKITDEDIKKIKKMHFMWQLYKTNKPTILQSYDFFKRNKLIDDNNNILDENGEPFIDPYTDLKIKHNNGVVINNNLYDATSLYIAESIRNENKVDFYNRRIIISDYILVKEKFDLIDLDNLGNYNYMLNIYHIQIEKKIKDIDENDVNLEKIEYINELITSFYDNIIIKKYYTSNKITISNKNIGEIIKNLIYYLGIINKLNDRIRLIFYPLKIIIQSYYIFFIELNGEDKEKIRKYYDLNISVNYFNKYLDTTSLNIFLDFCSSFLSFFNDKNYDLFLEQQDADKLNLLKKRIGNELAKEFIEICESNNISDLINFLDEIKKALSLIKENKKILKILAIYLIKKSFEKIKNEPSVAIQFIKKSCETAYQLSFKEDMKEVFEDVYYKHHHYLYEILRNFNKYKGEITTHSGYEYFNNKIFDKTKALEDARDKIKKEYDDFIQILLKAYENILKIYMLSFMDYIDRDKIAELKNNVNRYHKKAEQNFNIAKNAFERYVEIRPPTFREKFSKGIKGISSIFRRKKVVPVEQSRSNVSPIESIPIPEPEIPSLSSLRPLPKKNN